MKKYELFVKEKPDFEYKDVSAKSSDDVYQILSEGLKLEESDRERFYVLSVNAKGDVTGVNEAAVGDLCSALVHPASVFKFALLANAAGIILAHNHPSGDPEPSSEDIAMTQRIADGGRILGVNVLDHIIIGSGCYKSLRRDGLM